MDKILVWHRDDIRKHDNPALYHATVDGISTPTFIFDPSFYQSDMVSDKRINFVHECLDDYNNINLQHGKPINVISNLLEEHVDKVYYNATTSAGYSRKRDKQISQLDNVTVFDENGIVRDEDNPRNGWRKQAESYFNSHIYDYVKPTGQIPDDVTISQIEKKYGVETTTKRHNGGETKAKNMLKSFIDDINDYVGSISSPYKAEDNTSNLSPYFQIGNLSLRYAYQYVEENSEDSRATQMFKTRLYWNRHFTQKLQDNRYLRTRAVNPVFRGMNRMTHDEELSERWKNGETGYPLIDASMRALKSTGWMNFRMRAMCASFYTYILRCYWKEGADWFYKHLIDADPAINYAQWQMQSGLIGVHPLRIYNPKKQVRDNDSQGKYIKKYVPELKPLPSSFLDEPDKTPVHIQDKHGVDIGNDYPRPIVDFEKRRQEAREHWSSLSQRAKEALQEPQVKRRASLSNRRKTEEQDVKENSGQTDLTDFS